jgi:RNA-directed DNA polymerase
MLERAKVVTRYERWTAVEYARFADDLVILVDSHPRQQGLRQAGERRLREELAALQVEVNEEKSRRVDLLRGESFGFLGFEFRRVRNRRGRWMPLLLPKGKKRTALLSKLKEIFRPLAPSPWAR